MKKLLITLALVATTAATFAQGKITLGNDSLHLITLDGTPVAVAGGFAPFSLQLLGGTSAGSLSLQTTIVGNDINSLAVDAGRINNKTFTLAGVGTGVQAFLQLNILNTATAQVVGSSPVFSVTTGSFAFNSIVLHGAPGNSTWADAPLNVVTVPEPTSMVLAGLGAISLLAFRRRN